MKGFRTIGMVIFAVVLLLLLVACGNEKIAEENPGSFESEEDSLQTYTVIVTDEGGQPISGVLLQLCLESCFPNKTDANGCAEFTSLPKGDYKVSLMSLPAGYEYSTQEREWHFPKGECVLTIVLTKSP